MNTILQDLRYALRQLRRAPGFTLTAVLTLALGIGANTAIFSLLDQALLRSLPVRDPKQLVILQGTGKAWEGGISSEGGDVETYFSYPMYRQLRDKGEVFESLAATTAVSVGLLRRGNSTVEAAELVSGNYFSTLGVQPTLGRLFTASDDTAPGGNSVAVLSHSFWQDHLGADHNVLGETVSLNNHPFTIVGVAAPNFRSAVWGQTPAIFLPMSMLGQAQPGRDRALNDRKDRWLNIVGRLRSGLTPATAEPRLAPLWHALRADELTAIGQRSQRFTDDYLTNSRLHLLPGARGLSYRRDTLQTPLYAVMVMAALVLLIAATNVASLLLVRSAGRVREFSVRYALGATAQRVASQLLLEGLLIGLLGAILGSVLAPIAVRVLAQRLVGPQNPTFFSAELDARLLLFSFAVAITVSILFSLAPMLQLLKPDLVASLNQQVGTASHGRLSYRRFIVSLQIGLSVLLLIGAGLFVRTLQNLRHQNVGFTTEHLLSFGIDPELAGYTPDQAAILYQQVLVRMSTLPGVLSADGTTSAELANNDSGGNVTVEHYNPPPDDDLDVGRATVTPNYFRTLQIQLIVGRFFTEADDAQHPPVAIVNQTFARHFFGSDAAAIGHRMARGAGNHLTWMQIVGVTHDSLHVDLRSPLKPTDFIPLKQHLKVQQMTMYLRTIGDPGAVTNNVRTAMRQISPGLALTNLTSMEQQIDSILTSERIIGLLAVSFGILATLLAGIGLYGVLAYSTAQRTREIGIRIALGSSRMAVSRLVLIDVLKLTTIGIALAIPCALLLARTLRSQLYGVSSTDPLTFVCVVGLIATVALAAAAIPAQRAANVDPNVALRSE